MDTKAVAVIIGFWASLYLLDAFLKGHRIWSRSYVGFLGRTGISVSAGQIRWYTTCLNRLFIRLSQWRPHFWKFWFTLGVLFGLLAMPLSIFLLALLVINTLGRRPVDQQVLTPVMPGVNLPMNQISYYLFTLLICGILHEVGHAVAAVREQVRVNGFGIFFLALYPGAYVDLSSEHLQAISPMRQLRVYCAGVWHNFVIVVVAIGAMFLLPWLLVPFYSTGRAVVITNVVDNSAVSGPRGLAVGDHVTFISNCRIKNAADWSSCIGDSLKSRGHGFCMPTFLIRQQDIAYHSYTTPAGNVECCANTSNTHLCFSYNLRTSPKQKFACLPARTTSDRPTCRLQSDCYNPKSPAVCVVPSLDNSTKLLRVIHPGKPPLLFLGHPLDLHYSVTISDYVPNSSLLPLNLPYVLLTLCKYLISLSGALAILNVVPCYALDGQYILLAFIELVLRGAMPSTESRGLLYSLVLLFGTCLLATNLIIAMFMLFIR